MQRRKLLLLEPILPKRTKKVSFSSFPSSFFTSPSSPSASTMTSSLSPMSKGRIRPSNQCSYSTMRIVKMSSSSSRANSSSSNVDDLDTAHMPLKAKSNLSQKHEEEEEEKKKVKKVSAVEGFRDESNERIYSIESLSKHANYPSMKGIDRKVVVEGPAKEDQDMLLPGEAQSQRQEIIGKKGDRFRKSRSQVLAEKAKAREAEKAGGSFEDGVSKLFEDITKGVESMKSLNEVFIVTKDPDNQFISLDLGKSIGIYSLTIDKSTSPPTLSYMSPVSGGHIYSYEASTQRFLCITVGDNHDLKGILTRDLIRLAVGCPNL